MRWDATASRSHSSTDIIATAGQKSAPNAPPTIQRFRSAITPGDDLQQDEVFRSADADRFLSDSNGFCPLYGLELEGQKIENQVDSHPCLTFERQHAGFLHETLGIRHEDSELLLEYCRDLERIGRFSGDCHVDVQRGTGFTPDGVDETADDYVGNLMLVEVSGKRDQRLLLRSHNPGFESRTAR